MVRVNRNKLSQKSVDRLLEQFDSALAKLDRNSTTVFLNELFGKEERVMMAKRLAAVILILEGYSAYKTSRLLKLSPTTTGTIVTKLECGSYDGIIKILKKKKRDYWAFLDTLDSILHLGGLLPHRVGLDRYRFLYPSSSQRDYSNRLE